MALHPKLEALPKAKFLYTFDPVLKAVEKDLQLISCTGWDADIVRKPDRSPWWRCESGTVPDQAMFVRGAHNGNPFALFVPMRAGFLLPYGVEVVLNAPIDGTAVLRQALVRSRWDWEEHPERVKELEKFGFPETKVRHSWGGYNFDLQVGHCLRPDLADPSRTVWEVHSGYEGFLRGAGPRPAKFLAPAGKLEAFLRKWPPPRRPKGG